MIAFVRSVTSAGISAGSMLRSPSRTSQKTGVAPQCSITLAVAGHVIGLVITSSPGPTPTASSARWSAAVPEVTASTCSASRYAAMRSSSSAARGPVVSQPERSVSTTAAISSSPIAGGWKPSLVLRGGSHRPGSVRPAPHGEPAPAASAVSSPGGQDRTGPVGAAAERPEAPSGLPVDPHPLDALDRLGLLDPHRLAQHALGRDEEEDARTRRPARRSAVRPAILVTLCHKDCSPRANERARSLRSTPIAARQSSASWPPPSRAATSTTYGRPPGPSLIWV